MSLRRGQATQRKPAQKKASNRQNNSSNSNRNAPGPSGQARANANLGGQGQLSFAPVARSKTIRTPKPQMVTSKNGDSFVKNREYIQEVTAGAGTPSAFSVTKIAINPGQASVFPWLSKIAANYESYRFRRLKFCYETEAPSSLGGTVLMSVDYDASDDTPVSKQQMMAYRNAVRSAPWNPCNHNSDTSDLSKLKSHYVRPGGQPSNTDVKMYDVGNLFIASQNVSTASATLGELYVEYEVDLLTPQYTASPITGGAIAGGGTQSGANPFGTVPVVDTQKNGITMNAASVLTIRDPGTYVIVTRYIGTVISAIPASTYTGCSLINSAYSVIDSGTGLNAMKKEEVLVTSDNATIAYSVTATTITSALIDVGSAPTGSLDVL